MANQLDVNRYRFSVMTSLETAAKLRTYVKGKEVDAKSVGGRKIRKEMRKMTPGDALERCAEELVASTKMDAESRQWMVQHLEANLKNRERADIAVRNGRYRKPKSEWKKPGRVAGKVYPKYDEAMRRLHKNSKKRK